MFNMLSQIASQRFGGKAQNLTELAVCTRDTTLNSLPMRLNSVWNLNCNAVLRKVIIGFDRYFVAFIVCK
jgi:hypothetical protein